ARVAPNGTVLQSSPPYTLQTGPNPAATDQVPPYEVTSGPGQTVAACAAASSSGPNSTINDNCEWTGQPGINFNRITLATNTVGGTVSLEGGSDFNAGSDRDSVFYIAANGAPTVVNDTLNTSEDPSPAPTINVLANDTDPDGDALTAALVPGSG